MVLFPHKNEITKNTMTITGTKNRFISRLTNSPNEDWPVSINHRRFPTLCTESSSVVNTRVPQHRAFDTMLLPRALESTQMVIPTTAAVVERVRKLSSGSYLSGTFGSAWRGIGARSYGFGIPPWFGSGPGPSYKSKESSKFGFPTTTPPPLYPPPNYEVGGSGSRHKHKVYKRQTKKRTPQ